jgi:UDP-N-acetylmuramyl pentapeptide synthase
MSTEARGPSLPTPADARTFWSLDRVADALEPHATTALPRGSHPIGRVWSDTRTIQPGDLFVALGGEKFDAHDFLEQAVKAGAAAVVVSKATKARGLGVPSFVVRDTRVALGALATYRRRAWNGPVVGVVGTNGKTSTKELIRAALDSRLEVHATHLNLNNLVGVPQTLLAIPDHADVAVIEMGTNQPGEIPTLRAIVEPTIVVVTSIAEEHLEGLGDLAGVMREELAAADGTGVVITPAAQPEVAAEARKRARRTVSVGLDGGDLPVERWSVDEEGRGQLTSGGVEVKVPLRGVHNLRNATLALAVAREVGISVEDAARGIAAMPLPPARGDRSPGARRRERIETPARRGAGHDAGARPVHAAAPRRDRPGRAGSQPRSGSRGRGVRRGVQARECAGRARRHRTRSGSAVAAAGFASRTRRDYPAQGLARSTAGKARPPHHRLGATNHLIPCSIISSFP